MALLQRLALSADRRSFAVAFQAVAQDLLGEGEAHFGPGPHSGLAQRAAESLDLEREGSELALPLTLHGTLVGVLTVRGVQREVAPALLELAAGAGVAFALAAQREDAARYRGAVEDLVVRLSGQEATVRLTQLVGELASLLDLSSQARARLWRAALYHNVGRLALHGQSAATVEADHDRARAAFVEAAGLHPLADETERAVLHLAVALLAEPAAQPESLLARGHYPAAVADALHGWVSGRRA